MGASAVCVRGIVFLPEPHPTDPRLALRAPNAHSSFVEASPPKQGLLQRRVVPLLRAVRHALELVSTRWTLVHPKRHTHTPRTRFGDRVPPDPDAG